jgi:hypothetical protein
MKFKTRLVVTNLSVIAGVAIVYFTRTPRPSPFQIAVAAVIVIGFANCALYLRWKKERRAPSETLPGVTEKL